jgi:hypothetical protein
VIVVRKVVRSLTAAMLGWLLVVFGVCLAIPLARLVVLLLTAALCLVQPARVRRASSAWKGGKSHRRCDESPAGPLVSCPASRDGQSGTVKMSAAPGQSRRRITVSDQLVHRSGAALSWTQARS